MNHFCAFCNEPLPKTNRPATLVGQVELCPRCGVAYTVAPNMDAANVALAKHLAVPLEQLVCTAMTVGEGRVLAMSWDPGELLSAVQIAQIARKSKAVVQHHLQEGRFAGAIKTATPGAHAWQGWAVPRASVRAYLFTGLKTYTRRATAGQPPKKK